MMDVVLNLMVLMEMDRRVGASSTSARIPTRQMTSVRWFCCIFLLCNICFVSLWLLAAKTMPDVLHSLKSRYLELRATAYDQMTPIKKAYEPAFAAQMNTKYTAALKKYQGFQGPFWGTTDDEAINDYEPK